MIYASILKRSWEATTKPKTCPKFHVENDKNVVDTHQARKMPSNFNLKSH